MTVAETHRSTVPFPVVTFDLYRDIHKGIRTELFAVTGRAGTVDPADTAGVTAIADRVRATVDLLVGHAVHEDGAIQPALERHLPELAVAVADDHVALEDRMAALVGLSEEAVAAEARRAATHRVYVELASFTAAYLTHQDLEERLVMPALEATLGVDAVLGVHQAIVGAIPPDEMARSLALMIPAMNVDDRTELLGGLRAGAPAEVFEGVWALTTSVLGEPDVRALAVRLGL